MGLSPMPGIRVNALILITFHMEQKGRKILMSGGAE